MSLFRNRKPKKPVSNTDLVAINSVTKDMSLYWNFKARLGQIDVYDPKFAKAVLNHLIRKPEQEAEELRLSVNDQILEALIHLFSIISILKSLDKVNILGVYNYIFFQEHSCLYSSKDRYRNFPKLTSLSYSMNENKEVTLFFGSHKIGKVLKHSPLRQNIKFPTDYLDTVHKLEFTFITAADCSNTLDKEVLYSYCEKIFILLEKLYNELEKIKKSLEPINEAKLLVDDYIKTVPYLDTISEVEQFLAIAESKQLENQGLITLLEQRCSLAASALQDLKEELDRIDSVKSLNNLKELE